LSSKFTGNYFNQLNVPTHVAAQRPYFIWLIGKHDYIVELFRKIDKESFKGGGVKNFYCAYNLDNSFDYGILNSPKLGSFSRDKNNPKSKIINAKKSDKGIYQGDFQFSVGINLKNSLYDDNYLLDKNNYEVSDNYTIDILKNNIVGNNFTHIIRLTTKSLKSENVRIRLMNKFPLWVETVNSDNDLNINRTDELNKTFGIKYLIEGVFEAYKTKSKIESILEINISVNQ
jgi:hypothetical protein